MLRVASVVAVLALASVASANLFVNPGLEDGVLAPWNQGYGGTAPAVVGSAAFEGSYGANFNGNSGAMSQNIYSQLVPGQTYTVRAMMRINEIFANDPGWGKIYLRASEWPDLGTNMFPGNGFGPDESLIGQWQIVEGTWTAPADLTTLPQTDVFYVGVRVFGFSGNVDVDCLQFIPEPATMSLLGLGGLALIRRRR